jgi:hypothetical protein
MANFSLLIRACAELWIIMFNIPSLNKIRNFIKTRYYNFEFPAVIKSLKLSRDLVYASYIIMTNVDNVDIVIYFMR